MAEPAIATEVQGPDKESPWERGFRQRGCRPGRCAVGIGIEKVQLGVERVAFEHTVDGKRHQWEIMVPTDPFPPPFSTRIEELVEAIDTEARTTMARHHTEAGFDG